MTTRTNQGQTQSDQVEHDKTEGGTSGNPHADSLSKNYSAPVQSVNSQTGDVTVSAGGVIPSDQTVTSYTDLPTSTALDDAKLYYVTSENDVVASTKLDPVVWRSLRDDTLVAGIPESTVSRDPDNDSFSTTNAYGLKVKTNVDWPNEIGVKVSSNTSGQSNCTIYKASDASVVGSKSSGVSGTFTVSLDTDLVSGESYYFELGAGGSSWTVGRDTDPSFSYFSSDNNLEITSGSRNQADNADALAIISVGNPDNL